MQRAAQKAGRNAPLVADEKKKWLEWPEFLDVVDRLKEETAGEIMAINRLALCCIVKEETAGEIMAINRLALCCIVKAQLTVPARPSMSA